MLTKKDLRNQNTFRPMDDGNWYDDGWEYCVIFEAHGPKLYKHCETYGHIDFIKDLQDIKDLLDTHELLIGLE